MQGQVYRAVKGTTFWAVKGAVLREVKGQVYREVKGPTVVNQETCRAVQGPATCRAV